MGKMSTRRKLAIASWDAPREGNIYGKMTVDATPALAYIAYLRETSGERVTITHFVGKAVATALEAAPGLNGVIRFGAFVPKKTVDLAFLVALEEGADLAKAKISDYDKKSVVDVAVELRELAQKLHKGEDEQFNKSKGPLQILPTWLIRPILNITGYLSGILGWSVPVLGLESYPFGSAVITNVGVFGVDEGYVPPTPFARVPLYVLIGTVRDAPFVEDGALTVRPQLTLTATIDHRFIDGAQGGTLVKVMREVFANPWQLSGMEGPPAVEAE